MNLSPRTLDMISAALAASGALMGFLAWRRSQLAIMQADAAERAATAGAGAELGVSAETQEDLSGRSGSLWRLLLGPLANRLRPSSQVELDGLVTRLLRAGRRGRGEVDRFLEEKFLGMILGVVVGVTLAVAIGGVVGLLLLMAGMLFGMVGADRLVDGRGNDRRNAVAQTLPGAVDLLVTCIDAGLTLEAALGRVAHDLAHSSPTLAEELRITASEIEAGVSLPDGLRRMARRVGLDDLSALCGVIAQAHGLGAPIAQTLREYAASSRNQRMALLEEKAGKLSTLLTLPLATCLLPAALISIMGPAVLQLLAAMK